jgi:hypothetical protein
MKKNTSNKTRILGLLQSPISPTKKEKTRAATLAGSFVVIYFLLLLFTQFSFLFQRINPKDFEVGSRAERDLIAERSITYIDERATAIKQDAQSRLVPPVFIINSSISDRSYERFNDFTRVVLNNLADKGSPSSVEGLYLEVQSEIPGIVERRDIEALSGIDDPGKRIPEMYQILENIMNRGVVDIEGYEGEIPSGTIEIWRRNDGRTDKSVVPLEEVPRAETVESRIIAAASERGFDREEAVIAAEILSNFVEPNAIYSSEQTESNREQAEREVEPVVRRILEGEEIVREGYTITEVDRERIEAITDFSLTLNTYNIVGTILFLILLYVLAYFMFHPPFSTGRYTNIQVFILLGMAVAYLLVALLMESVDFAPTWLPFAVFLPTALVAMLVTVLINTRTAFFFSLLLAMAVFVISDMKGVSFLFAFLSGVSGSLFVMKADKRIDLIRAVLYVSIAQGAILIILGLLTDISAYRLPALFGWGALNGIACGILNLGILPILEHLLNVPTRFRLLELSDTNSPLMKKMLTLAPGTYTHSLNVANLAESACKEIGANHLLARVGAYYHDIGKIEQSEYFIENQKEVNKHDELKPSLSVAVIKAHVKMGIEKAKELRLPKAVLDIIAQHHGGGLISYFYAEAIKNEKNSKINREDYSYSEPVPASKEAAVVMLADTVEAATRTLKKPSVAKLEKFVWDLFLYKIQEKQLNNCELTMQHLEKVKDAFVHILSGYYHARIEYPKTEEAAQ